MAAVATLADFGGPTRESGGQIVYQHCPVCGCSRWKTYVNTDTGFWYCHAPEHSGGGKIDVGLSLTNRGRMLLEGGANLAVHWSAVALPTWEPLSGRALRYLARRGIDAARAARLGIVEMEDRMRVIVPYCGPDGEIIYWSARSYSALEDGPKYLAASGRHPLYVRPGWRPVGKLVVVEGVFDAIAVEQYTGHPCVALGGKALPRYLVSDLLWLGTDSLVLLLDADALGDAIKLRQRLQAQRKVRIVPLPLGKDPADLRGELKELL